MKNELELTVANKAKEYISQKYRSSLDCFHSETTLYQQNIFSDIYGRFEITIDETVANHITTTVYSLFLYDYNVILKQTFFKDEYHHIVHGSEHNVEYRKGIIIVEHFKFLTIKKAKALEESISMFSDAKTDLFNGGSFVLRDEDGGEHKDNQALIQAVSDLVKAKETIRRILGDN